MGLGAFLGFFKESEAHLIIRIFEHMFKFNVTFFEFIMRPDSNVVVSQSTLPCVTD